MKPTSKSRKDVSAGMITAPTACTGSAITVIPMTGAIVTIMVPIIIRRNAKVVAGTNSAEAKDYKFAGISD